MTTKGIENKNIRTWRANASMLKYPCSMRANSPPKKHQIQDFLPWSDKDSNFWCHFGLNDLVDPFSIPFPSVDQSFWSHTNTETVYHHSGSRNVFVEKTTRRFRIQLGWAPQKVINLATQKLVFPEVHFVRTCWTSHRSSSTSLLLVGAEHLRGCFVCWGVTILTLDIWGVLQGSGWENYPQNWQQPLKKCWLEMIPSFLGYG